MVLTLDETKENRAKIKVVGVGGAGGNALNRMIESGLHGVEFIAINTDAMALENNLAEKKISIGQKLCKGLGAGSRPDKGFEAIQEDRKLVEEALNGSDMVFIAGGMGGGTGTGAAPVVAEISRELGILTVGVVTEPFNWEGPVRKRHSKRGLSNLTSNVDTIIAIQNQKIFDVIPKNTTVLDAYKTVDGVLMDAVKGISDIILNHGFMQVDFADVREIMNNGGEALIGTGMAEGEGRAHLAAELAIHSPLLDDISISGAGGILVNITGGDEMAMQEIDDVMSYIFECVGEENEPHIIFGNVIDPTMGEKVAVTVIATGFAPDEDVVPAAQSKVVQQSIPVAETPATLVPEHIVIEENVSEAEVDAAIEKLAMEVHEQEAPVAPELPVEPEPESETISLSDIAGTSQTHESFYVQPQPVIKSEESSVREVIEKAQNYCDEQIQQQPVRVDASSQAFVQAEVETAQAYIEQPLDVRSSEAEETVLTKTSDLSAYYKDIHDTEQSSQAARPTQRMQELTSSFVDENVDYTMPAYQRNNKDMLGSTIQESSEGDQVKPSYSSNSSEVDETPAFLRIHE